MNKFKLKIVELEYENSQLKRDLKLVLQLNEELRVELKKRDKRIDELETKVSKLEKELEKYKVKPNEPSGSIPDYEKENLDNSKIKPGQKPGHKGISRVSPTEIHKHVYYKPKCCNHCNSSNLKQIGQREKTITEIEFNVINIKEHYYDMKCNCCGSETKPISMHGSSKSPFGKIAQSLVTYLSSVGGMTKRPVEALFKDFFKLDISDTSLINNEIRISKELMSEYNNYLELVKKAQYCHKDETSYRINGQTNWIWVYDSKDTVFYRLAKTRGKQVIKDDFGMNNNQISINDCYSSYNMFKRQQICWAHIIRESKAHSEKDNATDDEKLFYEKLHKIYTRAKSFVAQDPPLEVRQSERAYLENELYNLISPLNNKTNYLKRISKRLFDKLNSCFLFVEIKDLPSTNNQAERSVRPFVIHRKASFGSKSFAGGEAKVILKTLFENAKRQKIQLNLALNSLFMPPKYIIIKNTT